MKIFVMTDIEGAAGVVDFESQGYSTGKYYEQAKELLTEEVNAAARGAIDAGAKEILVVDGHGPGGIVYENIHPEIQLLHGRPVPTFWGIDGKKWDAMFLLAHHAMNGVEDGNLNHSYSSLTVVKMLLNGKPVGEIGMTIYLAGCYGIPCTLITGDEAACREGQMYVRDVEKAVVKRGLNRTCAISLSPVKAREIIQKSAYKAVKKTKTIPPVKIKGKCELVIEYISSAHAFSHAQKPCVELIDGRSVRIRGKNFIDLWEKWRG
jgi:D-amino peptidase